MERVLIGYVKPLPATLDLPAIFGTLCLLVLTFLGLRFCFRRLRLSLYAGGWGDLAAGHTMLGEPLGLPWQSSSVRVGAVTYKNTMNVAVQHGASAVLLGSDRPRVYKKNISLPVRTPAKQIVCRSSAG